MDGKIPLDGPLAVSIEFAMVPYKRPVHRATMEVLEQACNSEIICRVQMYQLIQRQRSPSVDRLAHARRLDSTPERC